MLIFLSAYKIFKNIFLLLFYIQLFMLFMLFMLFIICYYSFCVDRYKIDNK